MYSSNVYLSVRVKTSVLVLVIVLAPAQRVLLSLVPLHANN